jgi:hypothetical protein
VDGAHVGAGDTLRSRRAAPGDAPLERAEGGEAGVRVELGDCRHVVRLESAEARANRLGMHRRHVCDRDRVERFGWEGDRVVHSHRGVGQADCVPQLMDHSAGTVVVTSAGVENDEGIADDRHPADRLAQCRGKTDGRSGRQAPQLLEDRTVLIDDDLVLSVAGHHAPCVPKVRQVEIEWIPFAVKRRLSSQHLGRRSDVIPRVDGVGHLARHVRRAAVDHEVDW